MRILAESYEQARTGGQGTLSISTIPTFAANWFALHLGSFQIAHPSIAVRLDTSNRMVNLAQDNIDIGIRTGYKGVWPGLDVAPAVPRRLHADAQPLARRHDRRREGAGGPAQAAYHGRRRPLVGDVVRPRRHRREENLAARTRSQLGSQAFEGRAAVAGVGVAILTKALFAQELANGSLIQPFDIVGNDSHAYWLVYQEARRNVPKIRAFRDWMLAEIGASTGSGLKKGHRSSVPPFVVILKASRSASLRHHE